MKTQPYHIVRNSSIHGRGVFARRDIPKGARIIEYTGKIITNEEADEIGLDEVGGHLHTMFFTVDDKRVIDGRQGGDARYINHGCSPNCETVQEGEKIFIMALRDIPRGEELAYDYHLMVPGKITKKVLREYICLCGSPKCRGTQIARERIKKQLKKKHGKKLKKSLKALKAERRSAARPAAPPPTEPKESVRKQTVRKKTTAEKTRSSRKAVSPGQAAKAGQPTPRKKTAGTSKTTARTKTATRKKSVTQKKAVTHKKTSPAKKTGATKSRTLSGKTSRKRS